MFNRKRHNTSLYNTLLHLSRNLYFYNKIHLKDTFETRIYLMFIHFSIILIIHKSKKIKFPQDNYDSLFYCIEDDLRELGYGDVTVNKKMKEFVNLFYTILNHIETTELKKQGINLSIFVNYVNIEKNLDFYDDYFTKYRNYLSKNTLNNFTKDIINFNF